MWEVWGRFSKDGPWEFLAGMYERKADAAAYAWATKGFLPEVEIRRVPEPPR